MSTRKETATKERIHAYTVVDVETANRKNDSICSIGLVKVVDGFVVDHFYSLVDPEDYFDMDNIAIHGITPSMVEHSPNFREVYEQMAGFVERTILVAHNAVFDLSVLRKNMQRYGIERADFCYFCTVVQSRKAFPEFERHNLAALCHYLDIALDHHHDALCDAKAAQEIFEHVQSRLSLGVKELRTYQPKFIDRPALDPLHLHQALKGLDKVFHSKDLLSGLSAWYEEYQVFVDAYPLSNFIALTEQILADGVISPTEELMLRHWFLNYKSQERKNGV